MILHSNCLILKRKISYKISGGYLMKIAIPADDKILESTVCVSFGRSPYFLIYDTESMESTFIKNEAATSQGGAGIKAAQVIVDSKVNVLLTPRCGENAAEVIKAAKIKIYRSTHKSLIENIEAFSAKELSLLDEIHAGLHGHGG
jgi:predicted Fe-Mo cluster-binding NifX family protein